eukprot:513930-Hanusia_phi.AAC.1
MPSLHRISWMATSSSLAQTRIACSCHDLPPSLPPSLFAPSLLLLPRVTRIASACTPFQKGPPVS